MSESPKPLLLSLKPRYADLIFEGVKKAELRRRALVQMEGRDVFVYVYQSDHGVAGRVPRRRGMDRDAAGHLEEGVRMGWRQ